jgi:glycosyltransferase involved in cell wall biosynthesis
MPSADDRPAPGRLPLSVFLIARNEAERLPRTLAAVQAWAGEIVLVDSGSDDATRAVAEAAGARTFFRAWTGYGPQKRFAEDQCRFPWRLNLDADEVVTPALAAEIAAFLAGNPPPALCRLRVLNVYPGDARPRPLANDYNIVRLYHRDAGRYRDDPLFDRVVGIPGAREVQFRAPVHHFPFTSFAALVDKQNRFTSFQAEAARHKPRWLLLLRLPFEAPWWFLWNYLGRRHFTGGWKGLAFAGCIAFGRFLRLVKMLERG